jgi:hypothetical protein
MRARGRATIREHEGLWGGHAAFGRFRGAWRAVSKAAASTNAHMPRQGDLDGRGNLSRRALAEFTAWFLKVCLDQVTFMTGLFALERSSIAFASAERRTWRPEAWLLLERVLQQGEVPRGDAAPTTGLRERSARDLAKSRTVVGRTALPIEAASLFALAKRLSDRAKYRARPDFPASPRRDSVVQADRLPRPIRGVS